MNKSGLRGCDSPVGNFDFNVSGGVAKRRRFVAPSVPPRADFVPAGISTVYSVAIGKRPSGSNNNVFVPIHRHFPAGCGESLTGGCEAARSSFEVTATIGCENVTLRCGANSTSPSGANRRTSSGPAVESTVASVIAAGGNGSLLTRPARGGGNERSRTAKSFLSPAATEIAGSRLSKFCVASSGNRDEGGAAIVRVGLGVAL